MQAPIDVYSSETETYQPDLIFITEVRLSTKASISATQYRQFQKSAIFGNARTFRNHNYILCM